MTGDLYQTSNAYVLCPAHVAAWMAGGGSQIDITRISAADAIAYTEEFGTEPTCCECGDARPSLAMIRHLIETYYAETPSCERNLWQAVIRAIPGYDDDASDAYGDAYGDPDAFVVDGSAYRITDSQFGHVEYLGEVGA